MGGGSFMFPRCRTERDSKIEENKRGEANKSKNRQRNVEPMSNRPVIGFFDISHL